MDAGLQRRVQRYGWDKAAPYYDRLWQSQLEPAQTALLEMAGLARRGRLLDVACGTGLVTFRAANLVDPEHEIIGTDISEQMIAAARVAARDRSTANVRFERMDAENLRFSGDEFDVVLCALGLMYVPDSGKGPTRILSRPPTRGTCGGGGVGPEKQLWLGGNLSDCRCPRSVGCLPDVFPSRHGRRFATCLCRYGV